MNDQARQWHHLLSILHKSEETSLCKPGTNQHKKNHMVPKSHLRMPIPIISNLPSCRTIAEKANPDKTQTTFASTHKQ